MWQLLSSLYTGLREFSRAEVESATAGFSELIGKGGFGSVYKGMYIPALDNCSEEIKHS